MGVGSEISQICGVFSSKDSKNAHFLTFLNSYIHPNNFKTKKNKPLGLCPKPHSHLRGRRGGWQTLSTYPYGECWVDSRRQGKMHDFVALDPSPSPWGSKTNRSGRSWKPVKACGSNRVAAPAFTGWRRQRSVVRVQEVFPAPATWRTRVWAAPTVLQDPWGSAQ